MKFTTKTGIKDWVSGSCITNGTAYVALSEVIAFSCEGEEGDGLYGTKIWLRGGGPPIEMKVPVLLFKSALVKYRESKGLPL